MQEGKQVIGGIMKDVPQSSPANNNKVLARFSSTFPFECLGKSLSKGSEHLFMFHQEEVGIL